MTGFITLNFDAFQERLNTFNRIFPQKEVLQLYEFQPNLNTDENLTSMSQMALDEKNTIPFIYVYKPIFIELVSRWTSGSEFEDVSVIYALGRCISICPEVCTLLEYFLNKKCEYFNALLQTCDQKDDSKLHKLLLAYYRCLFHDRERFKNYIKPELLYSLLSGQREGRRLIIKFLAVKILAIYLELAEAAFIKLLDKHVPPSEPVLAEYEGCDHVDYRFLELNEAKRLSNFSKLPQPSITNNSLDAWNPKGEKKVKCNLYKVEISSLSQNIVSIFGVLVPRVNNHTELYTPKVVQTKKAVFTMANLALCIQLSKPVMLVGKSGSGKTFLINELAKTTCYHSSIVRIHLGEQTDAKLLLGTYTSGEKPGTFEWRSGVLTTAVKEGRWVLIEDIDKAPTEVLSVLLPLLERRELSIPSRGEIIKAANGFQLISTLTLDNINQNNGSDPHLPDLIGMSRWEHVILEEPSDEDIMFILSEKYPLLKNMISRFILTFNSVKEIYNKPQFIFLNKGVHPRVVSLRDLVKLCKRVEALLVNSGVKKGDELIESSIYDQIFAEAVDCFAGAVSEPAALQPLVAAIGESLEIPASRVRLHSTNYVPQLQEDESEIKIGRAKLTKSVISLAKKSANSTSFAITNHSLRLMEQISVAIQMVEPVLLVGETGTGKTTVVQQVAKLMNKSLTVINVSQQTESGDLLGGYKPVNCRTVASPILETFETLFAATFSMKRNERFYHMLSKCFNKGQWKHVIKLWKEAVKMANGILLKEEKSSDEEETRKKKRRLNSCEKQALLEKWAQFELNVKQFELQALSMENSFVFDFVEGSLVKAIRSGDWLLLDEVNLASADTLENITDLLAEEESRSLLLSEKGEAESIKVHPDFRIFACMNPATDVGKRDLPAGIRSRFTEIYVHPVDRDITDLLSIIDKYIGRYSVSDEWVGNDIAQLYLQSKKLADANMIVDGSNQKPHFSVRTLTRSLLYVRDIVQIYGLRRSLYEAFCMSFLTLLDAASEAILLPVIQEYTIGKLKNAKSVISQIPPSPGPEYVRFRHYWMRRGNKAIQEQPHYILTPSVEMNMLNLVRATSGRRFPILIQGPTSAGKTSMISYLADITGHKFVRINNHEHTDLQEYLGTYAVDDSGKLVFKEGILVEALRNGYWIVLDELNLAPSDVLEALNRLLDDNRELLIPETQEVIHPHPDFMLFATQNPPGIYGGRKMLSRAFRNRFLELHFDDIPQDELETIIRERCLIPPSYARKIVEVYRQLSVRRSANRLFEKKNSFATLRDLFRWAFREAVGYEQLAANGYMLLAERCRSTEEKDIVRTVIEQVMKVKLDMEAYYQQLEDKNLFEMESPIVWTKAMRKLAVLVSACLKNNEPILLVGETGCGKTTICQLLAEYYKNNLIIMNAHQNTETGDILGAQRPIRNRAQLQSDLLMVLKAVVPVKTEASDLNSLLEAYKKMDKSLVADETKDLIQKLHDNIGILFEWSDGPLTQAMKLGNFFLLDEISLADDSVLERLNSVLEPERSLLLAEKGTVDSFIRAKDGFQFFATMNPGGDYGKKELSPALRNRLTEIWVPSMDNLSDVKMIVTSKLQDTVKHFSDAIVKFSAWYGTEFGGGNLSSGVISLRDILSLVQFINSTHDKVFDPLAALLHGVSMVFIDALGTNNTAYLSENEDRLNQLKKKCVDFLSSLVSYDLKEYLSKDVAIDMKSSTLHVGMFSIERKSSINEHNVFNFNAPTTANNLMKVVRAMQVQKPILLEGPPGVGKTSLISALAAYTGNNLTRINLSEQTDLVDLFGSDAPGEKKGEFVWKDAPFLRAMQKGEWVLLDEMNLASQSVLEGLNACLDHRGEAYIPELDKSFARHSNFIVFAAQNPQYQGGGRKGLPKSFINRFSVVYVEMLTSEDLLMIARHLYSDVEPEVCASIIKIISTLEENVSRKKLWGSSGSPWEFNLRDTLRWLSLMNRSSICKDVTLFDFLDVIVTQRFRTEFDRNQARELIKDIVGECPKRDNYYQLTVEYIQMNAEVIKRNNLIHFGTKTNSAPLQCNTMVYESLLRCINHNWPAILVGPAGSGKTGIIHYIANITGTKVVEFAMNSDVDSMDILGGYEQVDLTRKITVLLGRLLDILRELIAINLTSRSTTVNTTDMQHALFFFEYIRTSSITIENFHEFLNHYQQFISYVGDLDELKEINEGIRSLTSVDNKAVVNFEWFDGLLVNAVEKGCWLILDNANLCSPSVLDRLNSLLETNGSLVINECSLADGRPRIVTPHPKFRLFLTVNPRFGELSRAMRNRGIEIYMDDICERATSFDKRVLGISDQMNTDHLEDAFPLMSLNRQSLPLPLSSFFPCTNSSLYPFTKLHDTLLMSSSSISQTVITALPILSSDMVNAWRKNVFANNDFEEREIVDSLAEFYNFLISSKIVDKMREIYMKTDDDPYISTLNTFALNQPLLTLLNVYNFANLRDLPLSRSSESINLHQLLALLYFSIQRIEYTKKRSSYGKINELSYLEQSAAMANGREIKNGPKFPVFSLLIKLQQFVQNSLSKTPLFTHPNFYAMLIKLYLIWVGIYLTSVKRNEARLRVYHELLEEWLQQAEEFIPDITPVSSIVADFGSAIDLTTGKSMHIIWDAFRKRYPSSVDQWQQLEEFEEVADNFDCVAKEQFDESYPLIKELRNVFAELYDDILFGRKQSVASIISQLKNGIIQLRTISYSFLTVRDHYFKDEFSAIIRFLLGKEVDCSFEMIDSIASNSCIATNKIVKIKSQAYPFPAVFDLLWTRENDKFISMTDNIFTASLLQKLTSKSLALRSFSCCRITQVISDAKLLANALVGSSLAILDNQLELYKSVLTNWYRKIVSIHVSMDLTHNSYHEITSIVRDHAYPEFVSIHEKFLLGSVLTLEKDLTSESLGRAWVLFGSGLIQLFVPSSPYDPAVRDHVILDHFRRYKEQTDELAKSWKVVRTVTTGEEPLLIEGMIKLQEVKDPQQPAVFRPSSSIDSLFDEWLAFMSATVDIKPVEQLLSSIQNYSDMTENHLFNFQQNTSQFLSRLSSGYKHYSDLNDIFSGYVFALKFGFDLLMLSKKSEKAIMSVNPLWAMDFTVITDPNKIEYSLDNMSTFLKQEPVNSLKVERILVHYMNLVRLHAMDEQIIQVLDRVLQSLYYRWTLRRMQDEKAAQVKNSTYRYNDDSDNVEEDFKKLFPDYEDVLSIEAVPKGCEAYDASLSELYYEVAKSYISLFDKANEPSVSTLIVEGSNVVEILSEDGNFNSYPLENNTFTSVLYTLSSEIESFNGSSAYGDLDFYHDYSILETKKATEIIEKLLNSTNNLLAQWPENSTLNDLFRICKEFLQYPINTPIANLLQKIEQIYTFASEWEKYAAKSVSLSSHVSDITSLIVSWRKLELQTWNSLFNFEAEQFERKIGQWWFHLFESIILAHLEDKGSENISKLLMTINEFFSKSTYGEFNMRLKLLHAFTKHIQVTSGDKSQLFHSLRNIITYYEQFTPIINEQLATRRKSLEKEIAEVILLASWKDVNIDALKQSSRRSHNKLYKLVRKYRELLSTDVMAMIQAGLSSAHKVFSKPNCIQGINFVQLNLDKASEVAEACSIWSSRPEILKNISLMEKNMKFYVSQITAYTFPDLLNFAQSVSAEAERLRSATPGVYAKDKKKLLAVLRNQKRKALSDTLKEFKRMGLKTSFRKDIRDLQSSITSILANSKSFSETSIDSCDAYYFRVLDIIPRMRNAASTPNEEIPEADISKGLAVSENLIFSLVQSRELIFNFAADYDNFGNSRDYLQEVATSSRIKNVSLGLHYNMITKNYKWLSSLLQFAVDALNSISRSTNLHAKVDFLQSAIEKISSFSIFASEIFLNDEFEKQMLEFRSFVDAFIKELDAQKGTPYSFVYESISCWLRAQDSLTIGKVEECQDGFIQKVDQHLRKLTTSIILSIQRLMENQEEPITEDTDRWVILVNKRITRNIKFLNSANITSEINQLKEILKNSELSDEVAHTVNAIISLSMPMINRYYNLLATTLDLVKDNYYKTSRATYIFCTLLYNLSKDGFCSPEPASEETEDNNLRDGTGLGDGEGAQSNSNDIEEDEDLLENAQKSNNDQKDDDEEDKNEDNAIDMEGEIAGELENASDDDGSDNNENEDELEEELDDLDENDSNAIDEKMWNEDAEENSKEKDSEKMPDDSAADDIQASKDDEQKKEADNKDEPKDDYASADEGQEQNQEVEEDKDAEDEEDVAEQEDEVKQDVNENLEANVPEVETMDLPDDMNLDSGEDNEVEDESEGFEDKMDVDEEEEEQPQHPNNIEEAEINLEEDAEEDAEPDEDVDMEDNAPEANENIEENDIENERDNSCQSDDELEENTNETQKEQGVEDEAMEDIEALDGVEDQTMNQEIDESAAAEQKSGAIGDGAQATAEEEQMDIGSSGMAQTHELQENTNDNIQDSSREEARESLKQLGDALKEYHRRHQEIKEASENDEVSQEDHANINPEEFEHINGATTDTDTQALDTAENNQKTSIDEDKAIEEDVQQHHENENDSPAESDALDGVQKDDSNEEPFKDDCIPDNLEDSNSMGAFIGERKPTYEDSNHLHGGDIDMEGDNVDRVIENIEKEIQEDELDADPPRSIEESRKLWKNSESSTHDLVALLSEQLRLILEPTLATKLRGDYKNGKRLNMKRIISYIASQFRKDKIWLRRTKPSKRQYQVMIAVDDSKSMSESRSVDLAFQSICLVSKALTQLESGGLSIVKFGETTREVHPFDKPFGTESGAQTFQWFNFQETKTDVKKLVAESIKIFDRARTFQNNDLWRLEIIISDGVCEDHDVIQKLVRRASENKIMLVFVIIDGINSNESILDMSQVNYVPDQFGTPQLKVVKYLDTFPFEFYVVVHDISELPEMLSIILRQYFSEMATI
ncbi:HBR049Cp [Eremothecium sinecaudum]|uniref:Midasin n=1 Tax=Eremothecium sinecaudum TaxID=45286 RepID=A0A109UWT1_9SACH|nr:HBR049Cp [Eremothecium sinecaudum]AMD18950.1 HBR049Cp [Eremothecium sinecaudum]